MHSWKTGKARPGPFFDTEFTAARPVQTSVRHYYIGTVLLNL
jgi:hypothetical protein